MKKTIAFLIKILIFNIAYAQPEPGIPRTPEKIEFVNVIVNLDKDAREKVDVLVQNLLTPNNSFLASKLQLMQLYFPIIEKILEQESVPDDLKYLAVQESGLNPNALSSSAAVGFWQFKAATGTELNLVINNDIDERKYIYSSTMAAATYFKKNNIIFKNWISSIYAYYQGATGAAKVIPESWSYASEVNFDQNTPEYILKALAHRIAYEHRLNRIRNSNKTLIPYPVKGKSLAEIAVELTVDLAELRSFNAWLDAAMVPVDKEYIVLIPVNTADADKVRALINNRIDLITVDKGFPKLNRLTKVITSDSEPILYKINGKNGIMAQEGDEAAQVAKKANISLINFLKYNDLTDRDILKSGQVYYLEPKSKKGPIPQHTAGVNQTFWQVSQMYGMRLKSILKFNRLKTVETLQPGRVVFLQKKRPKKVPVQIIQESIPKPEPEIPAPAPRVLTQSQDRQIELEPNFDTKKEEKVAEVNPKVEVKPRETVVTDRRPTTSTPEKTASTNGRVPERPTVPVETKTSQPSVSSAKTHTVKTGETLFSLAKKYGLTLTQLRSLNGMSPSDVLKVGQILKVSRDQTPAVQSNPVVASKPVTETPKVTTPEYTKPKEVLSTTKTASTHRVEKGQTLFSISKMYNTTVAQLQKWNNLSDYNISVGQSLVVSESNTTVAKSGTATTHLVRKGDTLFSIAKRYGVSMDQVKAWNNMSDSNVKLGQILEIRSK